MLRASMTCSCKEEWTKTRPQRCDAPIKSHRNQHRDFIYKLHCHRNAESRVNNGRNNKKKHPRTSALTATEERRQTSTVQRVRSTSCYLEMITQLSWVQAFTLIIYKQEIWGYVKLCTQVTQTTLKSLIKSKCCWWFLRKYEARGETSPSTPGLECPWCSTADLND